MTKYCPGCTQDLDAKCFGKHKSTKDGLQSYCLDCRKAYYTKHKIKILEKQKKYYNKNKADRIAYAVEYQKEHPEVHRKANKKYYLNHPERNKEYYQKNKERIILKSKAWINKLKEENPEKYKALKKAIKHRRRALEVEAEGYFGVEDIQKIYKQQSGKCYYCKTKLSNEYHIEHKTPLVRGGTNWPNNLCCSCSKCNKSKFTKTEQEYLILIGE
jgi:HNH endonuclease